MASAVKRSAGARSSGGRVAVLMAVSSVASAALGPTHSLGVHLERAWGRLGGLGPQVDVARREQQVVRLVGRLHYGEGEGEGEGWGEGAAGWPPGE
eukprot:scaffold15750_cov46-Phaeocystis_antarctica.AAC.2